MEITTRIGCGVACTYCPQTKLVTEYLKRSQECEMSMKTFCACLQKIPKTTAIVFCGMSEPYLNPICTDMIVHASRQGYSLGLETTLVGMNAPDIERLRTVELEYIALHLPSTEKREFINVDGHYLSLLKELTSTVFPKNYFYHYYGENPRPEINLPGTERIPLHSRSRNITIPGKGLPPKTRGPIQCRRNLQWNVLLPNGDVTLCSSDYGLKHVLGNLLTSDYAALFEGEVFRQVEQDLIDDKGEILCRYCEPFAVPKGLPADGPDSGYSVT